MQWCLHFPAPYVNVNSLRRHLAGPQLGRRPCCRWLQGQSKSVQKGHSAELPCWHGNKPCSNLTPYLPPHCTVLPCAGAAAARWAIGPAGNLPACAGRAAGRTVSAKRHTQLESHSKFPTLASSAECSGRRAGSSPDMRETASMSHQFPHLCYEAGRIEPKHLRQHRRVGLERKDAAVPAHQQLEALASVHQVLRQEEEQSGSREQNRIANGIGCQCQRSSYAHPPFLIMPGGLTSTSPPPQASAGGMGCLVTANTVLAKSKAAAFHASAPPPLAGMWLRLDLPVAVNT